MEEYILVGEVLKPQGIMGDVKVRAYTDDPGRFTELDMIYVKVGEAYEKREVHCTRVHDGCAYLAFPGFATREAAEELRGLMLYIHRSQAIPLGEDEAFIADLIGCRAEDTKGNDIGVLTDVLQPGSLDVYVFKTARGMMMMPALKAAIPAVDVVAKRIVIDEAKLPEVAVFED